MKHHTSGTITKTVTDGATIIPANTMKPAPAADSRASAFVLLVPAALADNSDYYTKRLNTAGIPVADVIEIPGLTVAQVLFCDGTLLGA